MKPLIAIPRWLAPNAERTQYYYDSLHEAGAEYVVVEDGSLPAAASGLMLLGGVDVDPKLYGEEPHPKTDKTHRERDDNELELVREALERDLPVLCVCRGHQLLNVAMGGSLVQDLEGPSHKWVNGNDSNWHEVDVLDGRLAEVYGRGASIRVNSRHHQGVTDEQLAPGLKVTARSPDGLIEAFESASHRWVVGVQWHPERPEMRPDAGPLFKAFVKACSE
jgi:gamma-glutamyl-gamma-aminobutyrate hydrolase PuuD